MEIQEKKIKELIPYEKNPRKNDAAVEYVTNSIKEFGFKVPIVIDKNGKIIQWLKRGYVHTHTSKGGRENNTRYPTKKEIKMYGKYIKYIGGKLHE